MSTSVTELVSTRTPGRRIFNRTYYGLELRRVGRDLVSMFFVAVLPAFFYIIFGAVQKWAGFEIGRGNVAMHTMIAMAAFGAVTATTGIGGQAAIERMQGWGRQLGLTPMHAIEFVFVKALVAMTIAAIPIALIYLLGSFSVASAPGWVWAASAAITLAGSAMFALYGLVFGLAFRSEAAVSAASGSLVILGFLGNAFMPLSGMMLTVAKFTPLYGVVSLARRPLTGGETVDINSGGVLAEPLWQSLVSVGVWTALFLTACLLLVRRTRERQ